MRIEARSRRRVSATRLVIFVLLVAMEFVLPLIPAAAQTSVGTTVQSPSAVAADSAMREAHYYLGLTYARLGRKGDSEKERQTAIQLEKEDVEKHRTVFKIIDPEEVSRRTSDQSR